jgi:serine/threonine protein phosphatase PrpC
MRVVAFGATDPGRKRSRNEDSFGILEREGLLIVADGMGGHRGGSVASKMAVEAVVTAFADAEGDHAGALDRMRGERSRIGTTEPMMAIGGGGLQGGAGAASGAAKRARRPSRGGAGRATTEPSLATLAQGTQPTAAPASAPVATAPRPQRRVTLSDADDGYQRRGDGAGGARRLPDASLSELEDTPPVCEGDSGAQLSYSAALTLLQVSVRQAAAAIYTVSREERELQGMGTTLTAAVIEDDRLHVAHAGDSRCYLWRKGDLRQVTEDHSWIAEQLRVGAITEKEAKQSRYRHVITRSIGVERHADVEVRTMRVKKGDRLLLCSDGLFGLVADTELAELMGADDLELLPARLIALANERGGDDNITAVVAAIAPAAPRR